jgi:hypothetical protein
MKIQRVILILLFLVLPALTAGCGGSTGGGSDPLTVEYFAPPPSAASEGAVQSTLTEISSSVSTIDARAGGTVTHKDLSITFPPGALPGDSTIKVALVSIRGNGMEQAAGQCYKISTAASDEALELSQSALVTLGVDSAITSPVLCFWDGVEWIHPDSIFDRTTRSLVFSMNCIYRDEDAWVDDGSEVEGPAVIEVMQDEETKGTAVVWSDLRKFRIEYDDARTNAAYAKKVASILEKGYTYYTSTLQFKEPVNYIIGQGTGAGEESYIYVSLVDGGEEFTARVIETGIMKVPYNIGEADENALRSACLHELFHLVEYRYSGRSTSWSDWYSESETECISSLAVDALFLQQNKYDFESNKSLFPGGNGFQYPLDSFKSEKFYQYWNQVFWVYVMGDHGGISGGPAVLRKFVEDTSATRNLAWLDARCSQFLGESLPGVFLKAYEDYYCYGKFFNSDNFINFKTRGTGKPFWSERVDGFSSACPYAGGGQTVNVGHMSGKNVMIGSSPAEGGEAKTGTLTIDVSGKPDVITAKLFYFSYDGATGNYALLTTPAPEELSGVKTLAEFGTRSGITDILVIMVNKSLDTDGALTLKASAR